MPDKFGLPVGEEAFVAPPGLSEDGQRARAIVLQIARAVAAEALIGSSLDAGGCTAFYTGKAWQKKEGYGEEAVLVVVYDGGDLHDIFSYMSDGAPGMAEHARERLNTELGAEGFFFEDNNNWSLSIYRR